MNTSFGSHVALWPDFEHHTYTVMYTFYMWTKPGGKTQEIRN